MRWFLMILLLLGHYTQVLAADAFSRSELTEDEKLYGLSLFWSEVKYNFGHKDKVPDLDWDAAYREFIPRVKATQTDLDYYYEMQRFCALLKDGHTNVFLPKGFWEAQDAPRFKLTAFGERAIVLAVDESLQQNIPIGSELLTINGETVQDVVRRDLLPRISQSAPHMYWPTAIKYELLWGRAGEQFLIGIERPDGRREELKVRRDRKTHDVRWVQRHDWIKTGRSPDDYKFDWLEGGVAKVTLNTYEHEGVAEKFTADLPKLRQAKAIILDIRKNGGGSTGIGAKILSYLTDKPFQSAKWRTPNHIAAYRAWGEYYKENEEYVAVYEGRSYVHGEGDWFQPADDPILNVPVIILSSNDTGSAAEDMLILADKLENITIIGERTAGTTGQPFLIDLPGGGSARISTKRDYYPDGREFIGVGVIPDVEVEPTIEDFRSGRDTVLDMALQLLKKRRVE